jgi:hypothetical protein
MKFYFQVCILLVTTLLSSCIEPSLTLSSGNGSNSAGETNNEDSGDPGDVSQGGAIGSPGLQPIPRLTSAPPFAPSVTLIQSSTTSITLKSGVVVAFDKPVEFGRYPVGRTQGQGPQFVRLTEKPTRILSFTHPEVSPLVAIWGGHCQSCGPSGGSFEWIDETGLVNPPNFPTPVSVGAIPEFDHPVGLFLGWNGQSQGFNYPVWGTTPSGKIVEETLTILPPGYALPTTDDLAPPISGSRALRNVRYLASDVDANISYLTSSVPLPSGVLPLSQIVDRVCEYRWMLDGHTSMAGNGPHMFGLRFLGNPGANTQSYGGDRDRVLNHYYFSLFNPSENLDLRKRAWKCAFQNILIPMASAGDLNSGLNPAEPGGHGSSFFLATQLVKAVFKRSQVLESRLAAALEESQDRFGETTFIYRSPVTNYPLYGWPNDDQNRFFTCAQGVGFNYNQYTYCGSRPGPSFQFFDVGGPAAYREITMSYASHGVSAFVMSPRLALESPWGSVVFEYVQRYFTNGMNGGRGLAPGAAPWVQLQNHLISNLGFSSTQVTQMFNSIRDTEGYWAVGPYNSNLTCRLLTQQWNLSRTCGNPNPPNGISGI